MKVLLIFFSFNRYFKEIKCQQKYSNDINYTEINNAACLTISTY